MAGRFAVRKAFNSFALSSLPSRKMNSVSELKIDMTSTSSKVTRDQLPVPNELSMASIFEEDPQGSAIVLT
jgi:hypothetical protein